jgi:hypothetical protein
MDKSKSTKAFQIQNCFGRILSAGGTITTSAFVIRYAALNNPLQLN